MLIIIKRCVTFLRQAIGSLPQESFRESIHPSKFEDDELRKCIQDLNLDFDVPNQVIHTNKRRKLSEEATDSLTILTHGIFETLQVAQPSDDDVVLFEQVFL
jgi:serine/threonine-protein kinase ATR